ncbi:hypothetical protein SSS_06073 [Sarcoptes scabiei]|nr:hypothetical protein SSS_06073 [Sarcoptes scabiei]
MRLTCFLSSFRREFIGPIPKHKGNVLRGKDRFVPPVTTKKKVAFFRRLAYEEEAMRYLSSPYISEFLLKRFKKINIFNLSDVIIHHTGMILLVDQSLTR